MISPWTLIGYYREEEKLRIFGALKCWQPTGAFSSLILPTETIRFSFQQPACGPYCVERQRRRKLNLEKPEMEKQWSFYKERSGNLILKARVGFSLRVYVLHELKSLLERAGWRYAKCYGGFDLQPFTSEYRRLIICCKAWSGGTGFPQSA